MQQFTDALKFTSHRYTDHGLLAPCLKYP